MSLLRTVIVGRRDRIDRSRQQTTTMCVCMYVCMYHHTLVDTSFNLTCVTLGSDIKGTAQALRAIKLKCALTPTLTQGS